MQRHWDGHCHRCGAKTNVHTMSRFNTDLICNACDTKEREHPNYARACEVEEKAVLAGNMNFPGIGKPTDL